MMNPIKVKKIFLISSILAVCLIAFFYWLYHYFFVTTDDAYVNANIVQIAARVTGQVKHIYVVNNQYVKEGQVLFDLDSVPFDLTVIQAKAQLDIKEARLKLAELTEMRTHSLVHKKVISVQQGDDAETSLQAALASIQLAKSNVDQAKLNLSYTHIVAPTSGWVTNVTLRVGDVVSANQSLFALISDHEFWIDANFKETDIMQIHSGQSTTIHVDMYPNHPFQGKVESISGGTGNAFSLLPPENATGNWVKVTQRIPVRIHVINPDAQFPLRVGTSASITISIKQHA